EAHAHGAALLEHRRQRIVEIFAALHQAVRGLADLDAMAAPPGITLAGNLRRQVELKRGQSVERDAGGDELLAGGRDQLAGVGDAIGFGDKPARQRIAVDAVRDLVVHGAIIAPVAPWVGYRMWWMQRFPSSRPRPEGPRGETFCPRLAAYQ